LSKDENIAMNSTSLPEVLQTFGDTILVLAAHPDDEVLGCGGTIARHADSGERVHILIVAEGATSRLADRSRVEAGLELSQLAAAAHAAAAILGAAGLELLDLPDNRLDGCDRLDLIKIIEQRVERYRPHTVYTHHAGDVNIDHRRLHEAVVTACRPTPGHCVQRLLSFEVASSTEWQPPGSQVPFLPTWFVDISAQWERKRQALEAYASEMRPWPHARSVEALQHLAHWRGATVGMEAAEAFVLLRNLNRA
jgi:LmbE family N-acetylglucosaminyl deacetylase